MKFKVGDKVRFIRDCLFGEDLYKVGEYTRIVNIKESPYTVYFINPHCPKGEEDIRGYMWWEVQKDEDMNIIFEFVEEESEESNMEEWYED